MSSKKYNRPSTELKKSGDEHENRNAKAERVTVVKKSNQVEAVWTTNNRRAET